MVCSGLGEFCSKIHGSMASKPVEMWTLCLCSVWLPTNFFFYSRSKSIYLDYKGPCLVFRHVKELQKRKEKRVQLYSNLKPSHYLPFLARLATRDTKVIQQLKKCQSTDLSHVYSLLLQSQLLFLVSFSFYATATSLSLLYNYITSTSHKQQITHPQKASKNSKAQIWVFSNYALRL